MITLLQTEPLENSQLNIHLFEPTGMECYTTPGPLWRESMNLWHFIEPSFAFGASLSLFLPHCSLLIKEGIVIYNSLLYWIICRCVLLLFCLKEGVERITLLNLTIRGLIVEIPIIKNCRLTLIRGKNKLWGREKHALRATKSIF